MIANSPPIIPKTAPTPVRKLPPANNPTTEKIRMIVPQAENWCDLKLITTALTRTSTPARTKTRAESLALRTARPKFGDLTVLPTRLLKVAPEAVYRMSPEVVAFASPPMKMRIPARREMA